jgi:hypothetical protein
MLLITSHKHFSRNALHHENSLAVYIYFCDKIEATGEAILAHIPMYGHSKVVYLYFITKCYKI